MEYSLKEVKKGIFLVSFENHYDLAMTFLRIEEYSENPTWKGKVFSLVDFMDWYSKGIGNGCFSYPKDWGGFNVSGETILSYPWRLVRDFNKYDETILSIADKIVHEYEHGQNWYLIGANADSLETIKHEIAHGFFCSNWAYRNDMIDLIENELSNRHQVLMKEWLNKYMYHESVHLDEIQAYFSTGLTDDQRAMFQKNKLSTRRIEKKFRKVFEVYYGSDDKAAPKESRKVA